jgi:hypothetical protein
VFRQALAGFPDSPDIRRHLDEALRLKAEAATA